MAEPSTITTMVEGDTKFDLEISGIDPALDEGDTATIAIKRLSDSTRLDLGAAVIVSTTAVRHPWAPDGSDSPDAGEWVAEATVVSADGVRTCPTIKPLTLIVRARATDA
jgi:hypothetical protein